MYEERFGASITIYQKRQEVNNMKTRLKNKTKFEPPIENKL